MTTPEPPPAGSPGECWECCYEEPPSPGVGLTSADATCTNTCTFAFDLVCDDGGPGSSFSFCPLGTECSDCGREPLRPFLPSPSTPPGSAPLQCDHEGLEKSKLHCNHPGLTFVEKRFMQGLPGVPDLPGSPGSGLPPCDERSISTAYPTLEDLHCWECCYTAFVPPPPPAFPPSLPQPMQHLPPSPNPPSPHPPAPHPPHPHPPRSPPPLPPRPPLRPLPPPLPPPFPPPPPPSSSPPPPHFPSCPPVRPLTPLPPPSPPSPPHAMKPLDPSMPPLPPCSQGCRPASAAVLALCPTLTQVSTQISPADEPQQLRGRGCGDWCLAIGYHKF